MRTLCRLLVLAGLLALAAPAAAAPREVPRGFHGVMYDGKSLDSPPGVQERQFDLMARSGVESVRAVFDWGFIQPGPEPEFDFTRTDRFVSLAASRGIKVLPVMLYSPPWARVFAGRFHSPPRTSAYTAYLRASIARYGSRGSFWRENPNVPRRPLRDWQVWNEPNIRDFWDVSPRNRRYGWPQGYADLLRASHRAIKATDPKARTVVGGLVGLSWLELKRLYRAGAGNSFDVMALHIYTQTEPRVFEAVRRVREVLVRAGDSRKRIFLTETAFPASRGRVPAIKDQRQETPRSMAKRLTGVFDLLARRRLEVGLDRVYWYTWASGYRHPTSNFEYSGLQASPDGLKFKPQPALRAFRRSARRLQGCAKNVRGACR